MHVRTLLAFAVAVISGFGVSGIALAQGAGPSDPPVPGQSAGNPVADTHAPGATATEAITDPTRVPGTSRPHATGAISGAGGEAADPAVSPSTTR